MKLFAVIYTVSGFAREDSVEPSIAGIYTQESMADTVRKAAGSNAKVVPIILDEVSPGYINYAKQMLGIDLIKMKEEQDNGLKPMNELDLECRMTAEQFVEDAKNGYLTSYDGSGNWATETMCSNVSCWRDKPTWATHVCWYNK